MGASATVTSATVTSVTVKLALKQSGANYQSQISFGKMKSTTTTTFSLHFKKKGEWDFDFVINCVYRSTVYAFKL